MMSGLTCYYLNETTVEISLGQDIRPSLAATRKIASLFQFLQTLPQVIGVVPAYTRIAVHFEKPVKLSDFEARLAEWQFSEVNFAAKTHVIPVRYELTSDAEELIQTKQLEFEELVTLHTAPDYTVAMIGFKPFFPYLLGMTKTLSFPRKAVPAKRVEAGSVAIGGEQTGIYPEPSPGGWWVVGYCDVGYLQNLTMGDTVKFEAVNKWL